MNLRRAAFSFSAPTEGAVASGAIAGGQRGARIWPPASSRAPHVSNEKRYEQWQRRTEEKVDQSKTEVEPAEAGPGRNA